MSGALVPRGDWARLLDRFGRAHHGRPVTVSALDATCRVEVAVPEALLERVVVRPGGRREILISLRRGDGASRAIVIAAPKRVWLGQEPGGEEQLELEAGTGGRTTLTVLPASAGRRGEAMRTQQIPRAQWSKFFREFSNRHEDWLVTVRIVSPILGSQVEVKDLPLEGIVASPTGTGPISIHLGSDPERHLEHEIAAPIQVWVEFTEEGAEESLDIESTDGTKTILQFRSAVPPETVDGLLHP